MPLQIISCTFNSVKQETDYQQVHLRATTQLLLIYKNDIHNFYKQVSLFFKKQKPIYIIYRHTPNDDNTKIRHIVTLCTESLIHNGSAFNYTVYCNLSAERHTSWSQTHLTYTILHLQESQHVLYSGMCSDK